MTIIGIDLGTTNSSCAIWRDGKAELIPNRLGDFLTPSVISLDDDNTLFVGKTARERMVTYPDATASIFKRYMGTNREIKLKKKVYGAVELSALILKSLKEDAETHLDETITEAVISVPAYFNDAQRKATILAGELAGLKVERLINEPTAAAMAYGLHDKPEHTQFIVLDLGGGTFDVSIMEYFSGVLEVHASSGDNFLGGEDFLAVLVNKYLSDHNLTRKHLDKKDLQKVYHSMEQLKREFNTHESIELAPILKQQTEPYKISRYDFEQLSAPLLARLQQPVETTLRDAAISISELDAVIMVGGATRMQFFRSIVAKMFRRMPSSTLDPDLVIAMGAAIQAGLKEKDKMLDDVVLTDVCPYTLGTGIINHNDDSGKQGDIFSPIIERNTVIPTSRSHYYSTARDNQTVLEIGVYQGESRLIKNNIKLGELEIKIPKGKEGEESIEVRFSYDMNGILEVDVTVLSTSETQYKMIKNAPGELTKKEIQQSRDKLAKLKFHPRDIEANKELIAKAERIYESRLSDEREAIQDALNWFEKILNQQDEKETADAREELSRYLEQFERDNQF